MKEKSKNWSIQFFHQKIWGQVGILLTDLLENPLEYSISNQAFQLNLCSNLIKENSKNRNIHFFHKKKKLKMSFGGQVGYNLADLMETYWSMQYQIKIIKKISTQT